MKQLLLLLTLLISFHLTAQELQPAPVGKFSQLANKFSVTATVGTGYFNKSLSDLKQFTPGELTIRYKASPRFSFGLGMTGSELCSESYYNSEGTVVTDEDDEEDDDDGDDPNDDDDDGDDENECDDEFELGENLMGVFTFHAPGKLSFFLQAGTGYSFNSSSPVYSVMAGYNHKLFAGIGVMAGVRYTDIIRTKNTLDYVSATGGLKAELGLSWNF